MLLKRNFLGALHRHIPELHGVELGTTGQATSSHGERGSESKEGGGGILMIGAA